MKSKKEASLGVWRFATVYALFLLMLLLTTAIIFLQAIRKISVKQPSTETEAVYVYLPQE